MQTKVNTSRAGEDPSLARRRAAVLGLLFAAQRGRGVTLQSVADDIGAWRSNLSAYISSHGQRRCIAFERLREALYSLGTHWDFTLRGRQFHRWDLGQDPQLLPGLEAILEANQATRVRVIPTAGNWEAFIAFVAIAAKGEAICLIRVQQPLFDAVCGCFGFTSNQPAADPALSDAVQSAWLTKSAGKAMTAVRKLLADDAYSISKVEQTAAKGRRVATG
jgi:hypothetical protein